MNVLQFLNRACRQLEPKEFTALSVTDQQTVIDCTNMALKDLHYLLPEYLKSEVASATLAAPITFDLGGTAIPTQVAGRSVVFDSDPALNQFVADIANNAGAEDFLRFPKLAAAADTGTLYGDVARLSYRVKSVSNVRIVGSAHHLTPWAPETPDPWGFPLVTNQVGIPGFYRLEPVGSSHRAANELAEVYSARDLSMILRVYPLPQALTRITFTVEYAPFSIDLADTFDAAPLTLPVLDQWHADLLILTEAQLAYTDIFKGDPNKAIAAVERSNERISREPSKPDASRIVRRGTPRGW